MSSITDVEKRFFEAVLGMGSGYVLDYTDATFGEFFRNYRIDIHGPKYRSYGTSKAKKMRAFWELEDDKTVAEVLDEMLGSYQAQCEIREISVNAAPLAKCRDAVARLNGGTNGRSTDYVTDFLDIEIEWPNVERLPVEPQVIPIIEARLREAKIALDAGAYLSVIFLCGSVLEGVLYGAAQNMPAKFNQSKARPSKAKYFHEWTLAQFIDVAYDIGLLDLDIKKFSHALRDFRNYIHPQQQLTFGFTPDGHTARVCFQVLGAALASVAGDR